jgi:hypothetical protein
MELDVNTIEKLVAIGNGALKASISEFYGAL